MLTTLGNAGTFLIETLFDLYILIVMLRVILQWVGAHFSNPVSQFVLKLTNPVVKPLRRLFPPIKGIDLASFAVLLILEFIKLILVIWFKTGAVAGFTGMLIISFADILDLIFDIFFFAIIMNVIISWVGQSGYNPITDILHLLTEPLLRPVRRLIPTVAGFDLSPIPVLIILHLCAMLIATPLMNIGLRLAI